ncbi:hypothetical protein CSUB01_12512 [Colletotrichum sublineola]|uniref:Uncharacterized protein n=1 Tax=Colletotrichum sublineola TaxID=1173701 RepID=A0A066XC44_COLSU|nr:hypothetical protein CSUB01_12512 [Colletotrichum sublineola]
MDEVLTSVSPDQSPYEDTATTPLSPYSVDAEETESVVTFESDCIQYHNIRGRDYVTYNEKTYWRPCSTDFDELMVGLLGNVNIRQLFFGVN